MSRDITPTMQTAINNPHGFKLISKAEVYPSRIYFEILTRDNVVPNADGLPASNTPVHQDILYNPTTGLVTFYIDGGAIKYAVDGNDTPVTSNVSSSKKPGVYGDVLYSLEGTDVKRYGIDWTGISNLENTVLTLQATTALSKTSVVCHGVSATECIVLGDGDGGFSVHYISGTTEIVSNARFMFPKYVEWSESNRSMASMGIFSTAFKLGNRIFAYMTHASAGVIQGIFYDLDSEVWSDIFTALPTDLEVSMCEFRVSNSFVRNGKAYICGQFIRTDIYNSALPYTLILSTDDGKNFSVDRFTLVSNLGYRFLGTVGSDNNLYLANCNRVCQAQSTWVFDGNDDSTSPVTLLGMVGILELGEQNAEQTRMVVPAGNEAVYDNPHFRRGSRVKVYSGYHTSLGEEYILSGVYIIDSDDLSFGNAERGYSCSLTNESQWRLTGLTMPFYAEIQGLSTLYDPMKEESGKLYAAPMAVRTSTKFYVDFWSHEPYVNAGQGISGTSLIEDAGPSPVIITGAHKLGIIIKSNLKDYLDLASYPKITGTSLTVKIYGWSRADVVGQLNDVINLVLITCDENGDDEQTQITTGTERWKLSYPWEGGGTSPITLVLTGQTVGRYIKRVGIVFEAANTTGFNIGRVDFIDNVEVPVSLSLGNSPWSVTGDGSFKVPAGGQPFIMFAQRPYNAWNFQLSAKFENTVVGGITGYAVSVGLVGLAQDAANYILARYDKVSNKAQLVKCRNGIETVLEEATPGWTLTDLHAMQFTHKDGHFTLSMYRISTDQYEPVLTYDWIAADGFLYTSSTATKKCGIYGAIMGPMVRILAYAPGTQDTVVNADGLAIDPLSTLTDFPTSGKFRIADNVYSYTGKLSPASIIEGPYQFRACSVSYSPPFGNGSAGLQTMFFDYMGTESRFANTFVAIDNGGVYICTGSFWRCFTRTGGQNIPLNNRSQHYSTNNMIGRVTASTSNKVWLGAGGFTGVSLVSGLSARESTGEWAILELDGEIKCFWFMGVGGESDTTLQDLIKSTSAFCGAQASFPGDTYIASQLINGDTLLIQDDYAEGYDMEFDLDAPVSSFYLQTNVKIKPDNYDEVSLIQNDTGIRLTFGYSTPNYTLTVTSTPSNTVMFRYLYTTGEVKQHYRILFHENNISVYHNYKWVASLAFDELIYTQAAYLEARLSASSVTFENIWIRDLCEWREAIFIDLETDGASAIASIIQERPIEILPNANGGLNYYYEMTRPEVILTTDPNSHTITRTYGSQGASDAIIYGSKDVKTIHSDLFAADFGFSTKIVRVPNLNVGGIEAGYRTLKRAYEDSEKHTLQIRPDIRIMPGDKLTFSYILSATNRQISYSIIVESVQYALKDWMTVSGRKFAP